MKKLSNWLAWSMLLLAVNPMQAQQNTRKNYLLAEQLFDQHKLPEAAERIQEAQAQPGPIIPAVAYLSIKIRQQQFAGRSEYYIPFKQSLKEYFKIADKQMVSPEKFREVMRAQVKLEQFVNDDSVKSSALAKNGSLDEIRDYMRLCPNTFAMTVLSARAETLQKAEDEWLARNHVINRLQALDRELPAARAKSVRKRFWGGLAMLAGTALAVSALQSQNDDKSDGATTALTPVLGGLGLAVAVIGGSSLIAGNHRQVRELKQERANLLEQRQKMGISFSPFYRQFLGMGIWGMHCTIRLPGGK